MIIVTIDHIPGMRVSKVLGLVSGSTVRARNIGLKAPSPYLKENNSYEFFSRLGDLIKTGQTETNVGDLHVALIASSSEKFQSSSHF